MKETYLSKFGNWWVVLTYIFCISVLITGVWLRFNIVHLALAISAWLIISVPIFMRIVWGFLFPRTLLILYMLFVVACLVGGEMFRLYDSLRWFDKTLHFVAGAFISIVGFSVGYGLGKTKPSDSRPSPSLMAMFAFCFSVTIGVLWEFFEFTMDNITNSNMLRWQDKSPNKFGAGLNDIMWDMIASTTSALIVCFLCWLLLRRNSERRLFAIKRMKKISKSTKYYRPSDGDDVTAL